MAADAVLFAASGFTNDVTTLIVLRLLAGLSAPVALGISYVAAVSQHVSPAKAAFNFVLVGTSFNLGSLVGAATGGLLGPELWLPANLVSGVIPAVVAVWALVSRDAEAPTPPAAKPEEPTSTSTSAVKIDVAGPPRRGLRAVLTAPVYAGNLLAYVAAGIFQGSFFSLMPVAITAATANYSAPEGVESDADADAAPVIAAVIVAASVFQVLSNFLLVRRSLRCFGAHGHLALFGALGAALCAALAIVAHFAPLEATTLYLGILCALYVVAYVLSATTLTVLNQAAAKYAIRFGARRGHRHRHQPFDILDRLRRGAGGVDCRVRRGGVGAVRGDGRPLGGRRGGLRVHGRAPLGGPDAAHSRLASSFTILKFSPRGARRRGRARRTARSPGGSRTARHPTAAPNGSRAACGAARGRHRRGGSPRAAA